VYSGWSNPKIKSLIGLVHFSAVALQAASNASILYVASPLQPTWKGCNRIYDIVNIVNANSSVETADCAVSKLCVPTERRQLLFLVLMFPRQHVVIQHRDEPLV